MWICIIGVALHRRCFWDPGHASVPGIDNKSTERKLVKQELFQIVAIVAIIRELLYIAFPGVLAQSQH